MILLASVTKGKSNEKVNERHKEKVKKEMRLKRSQ